MTSFILFVDVGVGWQNQIYVLPFTNSQYNDGKGLIFINTSHVLFILDVIL